MYDRAMKRDQDTRPCRVLILEDNDTVGARLLSILADWPRGEVLPIARTVQEAVQVIRRRRVDILVADLNLPDGIGTTAIRELRRTQPEAQAIVMSVLNDAPMVIDAIRCGATGYVIKDDTAYNVKSAIETALDGQSPMSATIARLIVEAMRLPDSAFAPRDAADQDSPALTDRETEVLNAISRGYSFREVGELLGISPQTVPVHARNIYRKLEASNKSEAVFLARKHGLIPP
jgi:DNA-binding NarL/FixJ family response regulator